MNLVILTTAITRGNFHEKSIGKFYSLYKDHLKNYNICHIINLDLPDKLSNTFTKNQSIDVFNKIIPSDVNTIIIDNENNIWITTMENGLVKYSNNTWTFYNSQNSNLPEDKINCIEFDEINNRIWVGTETSGIAYTDLNYINYNQEDHKKNDIKYSYNNSTITIESSNQIIIKLLNSSGVTVKELKLNKGLNYININNLSSGLYFLYNPELSNLLTQIFKM